MSKCKISAAKQYIIYIYMSLMNLSYMTLLYPRCRFEGLTLNQCVRVCARVRARACLFACLFICVCLCLRVHAFAYTIKTTHTYMHSHRCFIQILLNKALPQCKIPSYDWAQDMWVWLTLTKLFNLLTKKTKLKTKSMNFAQLAPHVSAIAISCRWQRCRRKTPNHSKTIVNVTARH